MHIKQMYKFCRDVILRKPNPFGHPPQCRLGIPDSRRCWYIKFADLLESLACSTGSCGAFRPRRGTVIVDVASNVGWTTPSADSRAKPDGAGRGSSCLRIVWETGPLTALIFGLRVCVILYPSLLVYSLAARPLLSYTLSHVASCPHDCATRSHSRISSKASVERRPVNGSRTGLRRHSLLRF
jgi:hypothetical protein